MVSSSASASCSKKGSSISSPLAVAWRGIVPYAEALELQDHQVEARRRGAAPDTLLLLEHPPVITLGRSAKADNVLASEAELASRGIEVFEIPRGGDVTYHAPGQLVGYLIADLAAGGEAPDVHAFLRRIEASLIDALASLGVRGQPVPGMTGVFVDDPSSPLRKLASIGVGVRGWVSFHGFALNVDLDLAGFDAIVPCGLHGVQMTSLARELAADAPPDLAVRARDAVSNAFQKRFGT